MPYFGEKKINEIKATDIIAWQNELMDLKDINGNSFSQTYLKTIHNQMSAILNYAVKYYELKENAARKAGSMGKKESEKEILFWIKEEYLKFSEAMMEKRDCKYRGDIYSITINQSSRGEKSPAMRIDVFLFFENYVILISSFAKR